MALLLFVIAVAVVGERISFLVWRRSRRAAMSLAERVSAAALFALLFWIALAWALALVGALGREWLVGTAVAAGVACGALLLRSRFRFPARAQAIAENDQAAPARLRRAAAAIALVPIVLWTGFLLWKGYVTPPTGHDAVVYHLPRAALLAQSGTYQQFAYPDSRINKLPPNYELLLATILSLSGHDRFTAAFNTLLFLLFLIQAAALAHRWWGAGIHRHAVVLVVAATPLMLLHGSSHKNDLLVAYLFVAALLWSGRWLSNGEWPAALSAVCAATAAAGTKPHGLALGALLAPILIWGALRAWRRAVVGLRQLAAVALISAVMIPLLGGAHYVSHFSGSRRSTAVSAAPPRAPATDSAIRKIVGAGYGEWSYLWQAPLLIWLAPFSRDDMDVYVPWTGERWFWPRYDVHDAHFGWPISILVLMTPFALLRFGDGGAAARRERLALVAAAAGVALLVFPVRFTAYGFISPFPRYLLYLPVIIATLSLPPIMKRLESGPRPHRIAALGLMLVLAAVFVDAGIDYAKHDRYAPLRQVRWAAAHPRARTIPLMYHRAGPVLDELAAPTDSVDVYGGFDTWIYPVMGPGFGRDLHFVDSYEELRDGADWVLVDRAHAAVWGDVKRLASWRETMFRGAVPERDLVFMHRLANDPRYDTVLLRPAGAQAIFRRKKETRTADEERRRP